MTKNSEDEIIEAIRERREAHAESFDYDLDRITADLQRQEAEAGIPVVTRPRRKPSGSRKRSSA